MVKTGSLQEMWIEYLDRYQTMSVATSSPKHGVDCSTVYFAFDKTGVVYFVSDAGTGKVRNIRENGAFAATMDDGGKSPCGIKILGKAVELDAEAAASASQLLKDRIPAIKPFLQRPNVVCFKLEPKKRYLINFAWGVDWRVEVPRNAR
ncbi:MAG: pyridoxamine 5'-phosphate oxidase family protein [Deltaproteobacteria bacterium]|nr:pyridoxamine 5'-phosphate oxidase family protein [Deltaproteobacteria bacterium]